MLCLKFLKNKGLHGCLLVLFLAGCSSLQNGFLGFAPMGDKKEYARARDLYNQQHYQEAVKELSAYIYKAGNVKRREARAYRLLGMSYEQLGHLDKALEVYLEALEFHPKNVPLLLAAAGLYQRTGLTDRSQALYERALAQEPNNLTALAGQAENYRSFGFYSKARTYYDKIFALDPSPSPDYRARYAQTFLKQRNYKQAFLHITQALEQDSTNPDYWLLSARAAFGLGLDDQALADLNTAILLAPARTDLQLYKIIGLYQRGHYSQARRAASNFVEDEPQSPLGFLLLALNEEKLGNTYSARTHLKKAVQLGEDNFVGQVASRLLTEWK